DFSEQLTPIALAIPEAASTLPDFLAETRWQLEWLLAMQYADGSGRFSNALKSPEFAGFVLPESDASPIALATASSMGTAVAAAVLAQAARVYRAYDAAFADRCEQAATLAYGWLSANPGMLTPAQDWAAAYDYVATPGDATAQQLEAAARLWAAAEIWGTTASDAALSDFEARAEAAAYAFSSAPDWVDPSDLGIITYLRSDSARRRADVRDGLSASVLAAAAALRQAHDAPDNAWGRAQGYWWGANGTTARSCLVLQMAERLEAGAAWMDLCAEQIGYLLGRNPYGRSQVTGIGVDPPEHPHHRPSSADASLPAWPGLLVGGPQQNGAEWLDWTDEESDYLTNETAINWNAALVYALAGFLAEDPGTPEPLETDSALGAAMTECGVPGDTRTDAGTSQPDSGDPGLADVAPPAARSAPSAGCGCHVAEPRAASAAGPLAGLGLWLAAYLRRRRATRRPTTGSRAG
ncbi:MAG TPA: glycoside hydrolase family 9 protein, partial [Polyangiaceae bacterium]|nr:glycoside hydrolase family 9 protein [Polyangiaceae bacterium]